MQDHERIKELLAGYSLRSLDDADEAEVERLLSEHVPSCAECKDLLAACEAVAGELGLATAPVAPPDLLLVRLRRSIGGARRGRSVSALAVVAGFAAVAMAVLSVQSVRHASRLEAQRGVLGNAVEAMSIVGTSAVPFQNDAGGAGRIVGVSGPNLERMYLFGSDVPEPGNGNVYRLWLGRGDSYTLAAQFVPEDGVVALELAADPSVVEEVVVTEESAIVQPTRPSKEWRWWSTLAEAA